MGRYGKGMRDCCDSVSDPTTRHIAGCANAPMTSDKALEAARAVYDDRTKPTFRSLEAAISAYLSALPGEAEVVELVEKMRRGTPEKQVGIGRHGDRIIDVDLAATDALLLKAADVLQAMQARAEAAEREREEAKQAVDAFSDICVELGVERDNEAGLIAAHDLKARVKEMEEALEDAVSTLGPAGNIAFNMKQTAIYTSDRENFRRVGEAIDRAIEAARTALKGGSNG